MTIWLDAHLSPSIARWVRATLNFDCHAMVDLGLRDAKDGDIFQAARAAGAAIMTKDIDFVELRERLGSPPQVIWLTCGNTSNAQLRTILAGQLSAAIALLQQGEDLVEIGDGRS